VEKYNIWKCKVSGSIPTMRQLISQEKYQQVIRQLDEGKSAEKISRNLKISDRTVRRIRDKERPDIKKAVGGHPSKLTVATKRRVKRMITSRRVKTASQAAKELRNEGVADVSPKTVGRALKEAGLKAVKKVKKPKLTAQHKARRREFAEAHKDWTVEDWKRVIWSDETKINRLGSDGEQWVWKKPGGVLTDDQVKGTVKFGGGSLMFWGCMTAQGVGYGCQIEGRMDAEMYTNILDEHSSFKLWSIMRLKRMTSSSSKTMIQSTPPKEPNNGLRTTKLRC